MTRYSNSMHNVGIYNYVSNPIRVTDQKCLRSQTSMKTYLSDILYKVIFIIGMIFLDLLLSENKYRHYKTAVLLANEDHSHQKKFTCDFRIHFCKVFVLAKTTMLI